MEPTKDKLSPSFFVTQCSLGETGSLQVVGDSGYFSTFSDIVVLCMCSYMTLQLLVSMVASKIASMGSMEFSGLITEKISTLNSFHFTL